MRWRRCRVSVLFSEPKIPQFATAPSLGAALIEFQCSSASRKFLNVVCCRYDSHLSGFSALQRAENSSIACSIPRFGAVVKVSVLFSEPKIPQFTQTAPRRCLSFCFSALQRAENSSMSCAAGLYIKQHLFQCSSASRKFLNIFKVQRLDVVALKVSVLFSEPKIPQLEHI